MGAFSSNLHPSMDKFNRQKSNILFSPENKIWHVYVNSPLEMKCQNNKKKTQYVVCWKFYLAY